jgi:hypothetical protein
MGQGLESSPYPRRTTARARRPVLAALIARNGCAHGGRLTAGCPAFSVITAPLALRMIVLSHAHQNAGQPALSPRVPAYRAGTRLRLTASGPPCARLVSNSFFARRRSTPDESQLVRKRGAGDGRPRGDEPNPTILIKASLQRWAVRRKDVEARIMKNCSPHEVKSKLMVLVCPK